MTDGRPTMGPDRRRELAGTYLEGAGRYDRVRPGYPVEVADWVVADGMSRAADIGAGTGIFTALLAERGLDVDAVDPSEDMLAVLRTRLPDVRTHVATAEATALPDSSADLLSVAQAWHWCDHPAALREAARVLRPGARLALLWNQLDVSVPWVHRLSRIMHAGDVFSQSYRPDLGPRFHDVEDLLVPWTQQLSVTDVMELARSRSYFRRADAALRARVEANLQWYLTEYLAFSPAATLRIPYYTHAWRASLSAD